MTQRQEEPIPPTMTLEQAHDSILQGLMQGTVGHYRIGRLYNHIVRNRLAVDRGYATTRHYFRRHVRVLSQSTLTMYGAVARKFSLETCEKYGMAQLGMLLEYARLSCMYVRSDDPSSTIIWLPRKGGLEMSKPFSDCTAEDMRQAVRARRAWPGHGQLDPEEQPVQRYVEALKNHFSDNTQCPPRIDAEVHNRRVHLRIRHLRLWDLARVTEALRLTFKPKVAAVASPTAPEVQPVGAVSSFK